MNRDWMRKRLESFLEPCEAYDRAYVRAPDYSEQVALEHLAVLSVVARWADETEVVTAP